MLQMVKSAYAIFRMNAEKQKVVLDRNTKKRINKAGLYIYHLMVVLRWSLEKLLVTFNNNVFFYHTKTIHHAFNFV